VQLETRWCGNLSRFSYEMKKVDVIGCVIAIALLLYVVWLRFTPQPPPDTSKWKLYKYCGLNVAYDSTAGDYVCIMSSQ